ncbi:CAP domain-containing protein [Streptomyces sp. 3MP-14]|uniref:CAP domain-containing protein n=1 Tax=Streptomyces mimosae TaxID=2586635 RepID=A0A5N6A1J3_9ACTN|nr:MULTISPECIES: CAP domain-containing protein [Streptomyces]KAB8161550.1 CAP domain-containing protein [Streptomyces mimosae]KAB8173513.1 CAP domain-containing protein [Streptomyces sp. 3MP-14]
MGRHRRRRGHARTGLVGASAALTVGAVAVGSGLMPGLSQHLTGERDAELDASGERSSSPFAAEDELEREDPRPTRSAEREAAEESAEPTPTEEAEEPTEEPEPEETTEEPSPTPEETTEEPSPTPTPEPEPEPSDPPAAEEEPSSPEVQAAEAVLGLVNQARGQAGCQPLRLDAGLTNVALAHSRDMAQRGYFDHTDPDGRTPWDRAAAAGVSGMGGENIAMGQPDAQSVVDAWMNSEGHRANILNCDFTTMGLGAHFADGGPWWTQTFGY